MKYLSSKNRVQPGDRVKEGVIEVEALKGRERHFETKGKWEMDPDAYGEYQR